jgi:hypothetical protein
MDPELRELLYTALKDDAPFMALIPGGLTEFSAFTEAPKVKPFAVLKAEPTQHAIVTRGIGSTRPFTLWVHDVPGDYLKIDSALDQAEMVLEGIPHHGSFLEIVRTDSSGDLADPEMGTILRYARFGVVVTV